MSLPVSRTFPQTDSERLDQQAHVAFLAASRRWEDDQVRGYLRRWLAGRRYIRELRLIDSLHAAAEVLGEHAEPLDVRFTELCLSCGGELDSDCQHHDAGSGSVREEEVA